MDIKQQAKDQLEKRLKKVEKFIESQGLGSTYLEKAKRTQRNINIGLVAASLITIAGVTVWILNQSDKD